MPVRHTVLGLAVCLMCAGFAWQDSQSGATSASPAMPDTFPVSLALPNERDLKDGDLVFRRGRDLVAHLILAKEQSSRFSHVGVVVFRAGQAMVVHAMPAEGDHPGGVLLEPLTVFLAPAVAADASIKRLPLLSEAQRRVLLAKATTWLGRPFDHSLRYSDDSAFYCTELVLKLFKAAGHDLYGLVELQRFFTVDEDIASPDALAQVAPLITL